LTPRVSVIVPVRNRADLLAHLLDALAVQTCEAFEVIVVDDGSTDDSAAVARQWSFVRVVAGNGEGAVAARRIGAEHAVAPVLAFTDSDCAPRPEWLASGLAAIEAGADVAQGPTRPARYPRPLERTVSVGKEDGLYATCNVFYRRSAFDAVGGFDPAAADRIGFRPDARSRALGMGEDTLLGWRVRRKGTSAWVPDAIVEHHVFPPDLDDTLRRAWQAGGFPQLVREVPELRDTLLVRRYLLGADRVPLYLAVLAVATARRRVVTVLATAAWLAWTGRRVVRAGGGPRSVVARAAIDVVTAAALISGSVRARTIVL